MKLAEWKITVSTQEDWNDEKLEEVGDVLQDCYELAEEYLRTLIASKVKAADVPHLKIEID